MITCTLSKVLNISALQKIVKKREIQATHERKYLPNIYIDKGLVARNR